MKEIRYILSLLFISNVLLSFGQIENEEEGAFKTPQDSLNSVVVKRHSPKKAALLSAILPGAGQVYNKKWWKLPIVYGGLAGLGTWVGFNSKNLKGYTAAYRLEIDDDPLTTGSYKGITGESQLGIRRDQAKRNLDLSIILLSVFYALNIVDATVDAHLMDYSITEDLSVKIQPEINLYQAQALMQPKIGLNFTLYMHQVK